MSALTAASRTPGASLGTRLPVRPFHTPTKPHLVPVPLEVLSARWRGAFDAAEGALRSATDQLAPSGLGELEKRLRDERASTAHLLQAIARVRGKDDPFLHLMVPRSQLKPLLGLRPMSELASSISTLCWWEAPQRTRVRGRRRSTT